MEPILSIQSRANFFITGHFEITNTTTVLNFKIKKNLNILEKFFKKFFQ